MEQISISSDAFNDSTSLPVEHTCDEEGRSPALSWDTVPARHTVHRPDHGRPGRTRQNLGPLGDLQHTCRQQRTTPGVPKNNTLDDGSLQGNNDFDRIGYNGPFLPPGKPHRYFFKVYALDTTLILKSGATKSQLEAAISGHILAQGEIVGKYGR